MSEASTTNSGGTGTIALIIVGGICLGSGVMTMLFGWEFGNGSDIAEQIAASGFNGIPHLHMTSSGPVAFGLIFTGIALCVAGNRGAWKNTGGY